MRNTWSIFKRELGSYFSHPIAYAIIIVFILISLGLTFSFGQFMRSGDASLDGPFFFWHPWIYMLLAPAVGMRMWSDEQRSGTIELLGTFPLSPWAAILGKFLAAATVWLIAVGLTFPVWITANILGDPDNLTIFSGYLGSYLVCLTFLAITMLVSAFTRDQVVCLIVAVSICVFMVLCSYDDVIRELSNVAADWIVEPIVSIGVWDHFRSLMRGSFRVLDFVWFVSLISACLLGTSAILSAKRA
ncbi:MAG: ABC transporter permease subunit [Verrucomicrobia bacterium]|jgi:ABC-2 type transport system permease protein|nr:ABC transporter permease subunit [Verrucomicrobiota bacterium]MDA1006367.1 ABC transporter permease subunit [Verrucomicrobiota bacterium]